MTVNHLPHDGRPLVGQIVPGTWIVGGQRPGEHPVEGLIREWLLNFASKNTRDTYARAAADWLGFLRASSPPVDPLTGATRAHVNAYARALEVRGAGPNTRRTRLGAVSSLYRYAEAEGRIDRNPVKYVTRPPAPAGRTRHLSADQARAFLAAVDAADHANYARDRVVYRIFMWLALRVSEVCAINVGDFDPRTAKLFIRGKGDREAVFDVPPDLHAAFLAYLPARTTPTRTGSTDVALTGRRAPAGRRDPMFYLDQLHAGPRRTHHGDRITRDAITYRLRVLAAAAINPDGSHVIPQHAELTPHDLRHTALSAASTQLPFASVQSLARHAKPETTMGYIHPDPADSPAHHLARALTPATRPAFSDTTTDSPH